MLTYKHSVNMSFDDVGIESEDVSITVSKNDDTWIMKLGTGSCLIRTDSIVVYKENQTLEQSVIFVKDCRGLPNCQ